MGGAYLDRWLRRRRLLDLSQRLAGTPAEADARIKMRQDRSRWRARRATCRNNTGGFIEAVKGKFSYTDYEHREIEDGETGTIFKNHGWDARLEASTARSAT